MNTNKGSLHYAKAYSSLAFTEVQ